MTRSWSAQRRRAGLIRAVLLAIAVGVVLVPLAWTALAALGIGPDNHTSPPSLVVAPTLDHLAGVTAIEPAFWQELATSVGVSIAAALIATAAAFPAGLAAGLAAGSATDDPHVSRARTRLAFSA